MSTTTGIVEKIANNGKAFNIVVSGEWYGYGFSAPSFTEGQTISFDWKENGRFKNVVVPSLRVLPAAAETPAPAPEAAPAKAGGRGGYGATQLSIQYQSARNAAIEVASLLVSNGALALPPKKGDQADAVMAYIDDLTNQFHVKCDKVVANGGVYEEELEKAMGTPEGDF